MGLIFIDGFEKYGPIGESSPSFTTLLTQEWTSASGTTYSIIAGLSASGNALNITAGGFATPVLSKTLAASVGTIIGGFRFQSDCAQQNGIRFLDTGTVQCAIGITNAGPILYSGNFATAIKTSTVPISTNTIHYLEWNITIGTAGAYNVYLDGVSVLSGTGNTRAGTVNNTINQIAIVVNTPNNNPGSVFMIDDLYLCDTTGSVNIAPLQNNPRIITRYPSSDSQTQWTNNGNVLVPAGITPTGVSNVTGTTNAPGANELVLLKITPSVTTNLQSVGILPAATSAGANNKAVLYSDSAGAPNTLTATGTQVTGTTSGTALTLPFAAGQTLTGGTSYWIGYITDTSVAVSQYDATTNLGQKKANTYASGAPAGPLSSMTTGQATWEIWGNATGATTNWESVATNPAPGAGPSADNSSILSTTVNNEDLYGWPALSGSVATVKGIGVKGNAKRSDTVTAHTIDLRLKSSTTDSAGGQAGQTVSSATTYAWFGSYFDQDPNGPTGWTPTSANAATAGPKLAS